MNMFSGNCFSWLYLILGLLYNMTVKGGTSPACAACKYQRRRCLPTCPLAPYFPANQPNVFLNVHRVFGVANVTKTLKSLQTKDQRDDAMKSMIFEADMRERYPVHGCSAIIFQLRHQLNYALEELNFLYAQLTQCREQVNKRLDDFNSTQQKFNPYSSGTNSMEIFHDNQYGNDVRQSFVNETNWFYGEPFDDVNKSLLGLDLVHGVSNNKTMVQPQIDEIGKGKEKLNQEYVDMDYNIADGYNQYSYIETTEASEPWYGLIIGLDHDALVTLDLLSSSEEIKRIRQLEHEILIVHENYYYRCRAESSQKGASSSLLSAQPQVCNRELKNAAADFSL